MNILEKKEHYIILFDFYEVLLTTRQREYFKGYYFEDMSLAELANTYDVSRNAIHDGLNKIYNILEDYEKKLELYRKFKERNNLYEKLLENHANNEIIERLKNLD